MGRPHRKKDIAVIRTVHSLKPMYLVNMKLFRLQPHVQLRTFYPFRM